MSLLELKGLTKRFGGLVAVNDLSFEVHAGEVVGLLGPNGSGKTTAMNLVSGALAPSAGEVRFAGRTISGLASHRIARLGVARTFQLVRVLGGMHCRDNVAAGLAFRPGGLHGRAAEHAAQQLLERVGLGAQAELPASELTYIDQKRLELARALALAPRLLLLDEWLAGLNPTELQQGIALIAALRDEGMTVLMVEHVMDAVHALCSRCVVMNAGTRIAEGPTRAVLGDARVIEAYLGSDEIAQAPHA
ncbi:MAG: ATP-binding cassette domain-containing protein [Comamonas sp.]